MQSGGQRSGQFGLSVQLETGIDQTDVCNTRRTSAEICASANGQRETHAQQNVKRMQQLSILQQHDIRRQREQEALLLIGGNYTWADCTPTRRRLKSRFTRPVLAISWPFSSSVSSLTKPPLLPDRCLCRPSSHAPVSSVPSGLPQQDGPAPARPLPPPQSTGATGRTSTAQ